MLMCKDLELENGVYLIIVYSLKGLEFNIVFIFDVIKDLWEGN